MAVLSKLNGLARRIEALELEEYSSQDDALTTWGDILSFLFWRNRHGDNWQSVWDSQLRENPIKTRCNHLSFYLYRFADLLTISPYDERVPIAIDSAVSSWVEDGITYSQLATIEGMYEAFTVIDSLLNNDEIWQSYHEAKRMESEHSELRHKFRTAFHAGDISADGLEWLREFDADFYQHNSGTPVIVVPAIPIQPVYDNPIVQPGPVVQPIQPVSDIVECIWIGADEGWQVIMADGKSAEVHRNRPYLITLSTWQNMQADAYLARRWQRVNG